MNNCFRSLHDSKAIESDNFVKNDRLYRENNGREKEGRE